MTNEELRDDNHHVNDDEVVLRLQKILKFTQATLIIALVLGVVVLRRRAS